MFGSKFFVTLVSFLLIFPVFSEDIEEIVEEILEEEIKEEKKELKTAGLEEVPQLVWYGLVAAVVIVIAKRRKLI